MRRLIRPLCLLIVVQAICLGTGFWFQYQLVVSTTARQVTESAWSELAVQSDPTIEIARNLASANLNWAAFSQIVSQSFLEDDPFQAGLMLADSKGMILGFTRSASTGKWRVGEQITWKPDRDASTPVGPKFGRIVTNQGERIAICYAIPDSDRQIVVYSTTPTTPPWKQALQGSLVLASGLGFFWTLSLSVVAIVLLMSRFELNATQQKTELDHDALRNAQDLLKTRDAVIFGLAKLAESRDPETGLHLERISLYSTRFATALRPYPKYQRMMTPTFVRLLGISSVLHDIGKVGVEDTVLLKPGKLTDHEYQTMQQHTLIAGDCLSEIEQRLGASNFLQTAREIALHHHERWDGTGYPHKLAGESIPLAARIVSICDVYDALRSKRIYKAAMPHEECVSAIRNAAGSQFDPELVEIFLTIESEFATISRRFTSNAETPNRAVSSDDTSEGRIVSYPDSTALNSTTVNPKKCEDSHSMTSVA